MTARRLFFAVLLIASAAHAGWRSVAPGVDYQEFRAGNIHVTRINVASDQIRIVVSNESDKGLKVSDYARKVKAIAAVNGDYFDDAFTPAGFAVGPCGPWASAKDAKREIVLQIANQRGALRKRTDLGDAPVDAAISGWPLLVAECKAVQELPGSNAFTRAPHPRTALGISGDGTLLYFVVAEGRRSGLPGLTLAELAAFMAGELGVCSAMNLDGGGSTAMWVGDKIVSRLSDGVERPVGDAIAVILRRDFKGCEPADIDRLADAYNRQHSEAAAVALAHAKASNGDREGALHLLKDFLQTSPNSPRAKELAAQLAASPELRLERINKAILLQPDNLGLQVEKARLQFEAGQTAAALATIRLVRARTSQKIEGLDELERAVREKH